MRVKALPRRKVRQARKPKDLFTASQVARFCQVDLKTIHNWAERGEVPHFRTPGRHLRFRRADILHFLRKYGYPIPSELDGQRPRVGLMVNGDRARDAIQKTLEVGFDVDIYPDAVAGLLRMGRRPPDAVVLAASVGPLTGAEIIAGLKSAGNTQHVRAVVFTDGEFYKKDALEAGASAYVNAFDLPGLKDTLEALMGVRR